MHIIFGLFLIGYGVVSIVWPDFSFRWEERKYKDQREPSQEHLDKSRFWGVAAIIIGILAVVGIFDITLSD